ncbi:hypothetical protein BHM03_00000913 [Ensete ventricosum]|nr:hypothetical protein BHM03_00000913 [Ensete ventricosum]
MHPSYKKTQAELLVLDRALPTIKSEASSLYADHVIATVPGTPPVACYQGCCRLVGPSHSLCHGASRLLSRVPQAGQPVASALPCRQSCCWPPAVRCATDRLGLRIFQLTLHRPGQHPMYVRLSDTMTWLSDVAEVGVSCSGVGGPTIIGPIKFHRLHQF